jgi:hypothetical protein
VYLCAIVVSGVDVDVVKQKVPFMEIKEGFSSRRFVSKALPLKMIAESSPTAPPWKRSASSPAMYL